MKNQPIPRLPLSGPLWCEAASFSLIPALPSGYQPIPPSSAPASLQRWWEARGMWLSCCPREKLVLIRGGHPIKGYELSRVKINKNIFTFITHLTDVVPMGFQRTLHRLVFQNHTAPLRGRSVLFPSAWWVLRRIWHSPQWGLQPPLVSKMHTRSPEEQKRLCDGSRIDRSEQTRPQDAARQSTGLLEAWLFLTCPS